MAGSDVDFGSVNSQQTTRRGRLAPQLAGTLGTVIISLRAAGGYHSTVLQDRPQTLSDINPDVHIAERSGPAPSNIGCLVRA